MNSLFSTIVGSVTLASLALLLSIGGPAGAAEPAPNAAESPVAADSTPWQLLSGAGEATSVPMAPMPFPASKAMMVTITQTDFYLKGIQLFQEGIPIVQGRHYTLEFWGKSEAETPRTIEAMVMANVDEIGLQRTCNLTSEWKFIRCAFEATEDNKGARLGLGVGLEPGVYYVAAVSLKGEDGKELVRDGMFEKPLRSSPWALGNRRLKPAWKIVSCAQDGLTIQVPAAAGASNASLVRKGVRLNKNRVYRLSFWARSPENRSLAAKIVRIAKAGDPALMKSAPTPIPVSAGPQWSRTEVFFQGPETDSEAEFQLDLGAAAGSCELTGLELKDVGALQDALGKDEEAARYMAANRFAAKYASYHAAPAVSPGAWIALRQGGRLAGDYAFLMNRIEGDDNVALPDLPPEADPNYGNAMVSAGPTSQRFGVWARQIPAYGKMRFDLNEAFAVSLDDQPAKLRVVYLDNAPGGKFTVFACGLMLTQELGMTQQWKEVVFDIPYASFRAMDHLGSDIIIYPEMDLTLHMVEVQRVAPVELHQLAAE